MDKATPPKRGRPTGIPKTGGRAKGTPNKLTRDIKAMILGALDRVGGEDYFVHLAENEPKAFAALLGRLLPTAPPSALVQGGRMTIEWPDYNPTDVDYD